MNCKKLYENIVTMRKKFGLKNDEIGEALGYKDGVFEVKISRLKSGNDGAVTVRDITELMKLFDCRADVILNGVLRD